MSLVHVFFYSVALLPGLFLSLHAADCAGFDLSAASEPSFRSARSDATAKPAAETVSLQLHDGLLKPQLDLLLREQFGVQVIEWRASTHHLWPTVYLLHGSSWRQLLQQMLEPYQLRVTLHANHTAVVDYQQPQRAAL